MKDNIKFFRDIVNSSLKDIHMTDELKQETLNRCKKQNKIRIRPAYVAGICAAFMAFATTGYSYLFPDKIDIKYSLNISATERQLENLGNLIKNSIINPSLNNTALKDDKYAYNNKENTQNGDKTPKNLKDTKHATDINDKSNADAKIKDILNPVNNIPSTKDKTENKIAPKDIQSEIVSTNSESKKQSDGNVSSNQASPEKNTSEENNDVQENTTASISSVSPHLMNMNSVENSFGRKVAKPSHIPDGFKLVNINIPDNDNEKFVKMNYASKDQHFTILQDRNINFNNNVGEKLYINGVQAYSSWVENCSELRVALNKNNIQYVIQGNISKETLVSIMESMD